MSSLFADVLLPLPLKDLYTYSIPEQLSEVVKVGQRVVVQFGKQKIYSALVYHIHDNPPKDYKAKEILSVLDTVPIVNSVQYKFWDWLAEYYMCTKGEVMNVALPSTLKLASETRIALNMAFNKDTSLLNDREYLIFEALEIQKLLSVSDVARIINVKNPVPVIKAMIEKGAVISEEQLEESYKPKTLMYVRLAQKYEINEEQLRQIMDTLNKKAYKQLELLMIYLHLSKKYDDIPKKEQRTSNNELRTIDVRRSELMNNPKASEAALNALVKKGILEVFRKQVSRLEQKITETNDDAELNNDQQRALNEIEDAFNSKEVALLNGVTSSGKTEIYVKIIRKMMQKGKQVLYLVPEISLTTQLIMRLKKYFANEIGVYHSRFTKDERVEIWNNISGKGNSTLNIQHSALNIIVGPRSALFLPFSNLGLIIIDEEHDPSFKQNDIAPHYNARDAAVYLAMLHNAKVLLGSATPSLESYYNTQTGKYSLVELSTRYLNIKLPEIIVVNVREETRNRRMKSHFSQLLLDSIQLALDSNEQVILFQNRRGFSLRLECYQCSWIPHCKNCDVTLIYHKQTNQLQCHYCGYSIPVPELCPACGSTHLKMKGFGTEKIEDELPLFFPKARIARMDLDTTRTRNAYHQLIQDFQERQLDILVGTQMVTKGLDFDNVSVVGIMNADSMLSYPDFRTFERGFQQFSQVSGRAGRKKGQGRVIIQTYNPSHTVINYVVNHDYQAMYKSQLADRRSFSYPPFYRLIKISLKHRNENLLNEASEYLAKALRRRFGKRILGPEFPVVAKIRNFYYKDILIKIEKESAVMPFKNAILEKLHYFSLTYKSVRIIIDVDPQ